MTISSTTRKVGPFIGNDVTTVFPFTFKVFLASDLLVVRTNTLTGVQSTLTLGPDYSVTLNPDQDGSPGGSVTTGIALATNYTLIISSAVPATQNLDLQNLGGFNPGDINGANDRSMMVLQQMVEEVSRCVRIPISDPDLNTELPIASQRLGKVLGFDAVTGAPIATANVGAQGAPGTPGANGGNGYVNTVSDATVPAGNNAGSGASANAALTTAVATYAGKTLMVPSGSVHHITADLSLVGNEVMIGGGGGFYVDSGKTLTLFAPTISLRQAFWGPGTVTVFGVDPAAEWYGATGDGATNDAPAIQRCLDQNPARTTLLSQHRLTPGITPFDYACSSQLIISGKGTGLRGAFAGGTPRFDGGGVKVKWPTSVACVRMDTDNTCGYLGYLQLWAGDVFDRTIQSTYEDFTAEADFTGTTTSAGTPLGLDVVQVLGGTPTIEFVMAYGGKRHGFYVNGASAGQPDLGRFVGLYTNSNRGYGIYAHGADANVAVYASTNSWFNAMGGVADKAQYGNTHVADHSSGNASFAAIAAGGNVNISGIVVDGSHIATITTATPHGWSPAQWITTVPTDGTFANTAKLITASGTTATYKLPSKTSTSTGAGGTGATSSVAQILAYYTANSLQVGAYIALTASSGYSTWINPYIESNSGTPLWGSAVVHNQQGAVSYATGTHYASDRLAGFQYLFVPRSASGYWSLTDPTGVTGLVTIDGVGAVGNITMLGALKMGGSFPNTGQIRLKNGSTNGIYFANAANNGNKFGMYVDGSNVLNIGDSATAVAGTLSVSSTLAVTGLITATGGIKVGASGTSLTQAKVYSQTLTPAATAANTAVEQTFTVTGLTTADKVFINPGAMGNACIPVCCRVTAADTLGITFLNPTAGSLTSSSVAYQITAIRS